MTVNVHEQAEDRGAKRAAGALERHREEVTLALQDRPGFDLATISEDDFMAGLDRLKLRQQRMQKILDTALVDGVHYGNPKLGSRNAFQKPMLYQAGAEELMTLWRLTPRHAEPPLIDASELYTAVTVSIAMHDSAGRVVAVRSGHCNTLEKRFQKQNGGKTYTDAREMVHQCLAMAEKRAITFAVRAATGATGFFASEEEMDAALAEDAPAPEPWTEDERNAVIKAAAKAGLRTRDALKAFAEKVLGRAFVGTGKDVATLLSALDAKQHANPRPVKVPDDPYLGTDKAPDFGPDAAFELEGEAP